MTWLDETSVGRRILKREPGRYAVAKLPQHIQSAWPDQRQRCAAIRFALVPVDQPGAQTTRSVPLGEPFASTDIGDFERPTTGGGWAKTWAKGSQPF